MRALFLTTAMIAVVQWAAQAPRAQEKSDSTTQDELMARAMELAQPGDEHKLLEKLAGVWDFEATQWPSPGAEASTYPGQADAKMVYQKAADLQQTYNGQKVVKFDKSLKK